MAEGPIIGGVPKAPKNHGYEEYCWIIAHLASAERYSHTLLLDESKSSRRRRSLTETPLFMAFESVDGSCVSFNDFFQRRPMGRNQMIFWETEGQDKDTAFKSWTKLRDFVTKIHRLRNNETAAWRKVLPQEAIKKKRDFVKEFGDPFKHLSIDQIEIFLARCDENLLLLESDTPSEEMSGGIDLRSREKSLREYMRKATRPVRTPALLINIKLNKNHEFIEYSKYRQERGTAILETRPIHAFENPYLLVETTLLDDNSRFSLDGKGTALDEEWGEGGRTFAEAINERMASYTRIEIETTTQNLHIDWLPRASPWPPSIDTLHFIQSLGKVKRFLTENGVSAPRVISDIGCGTGILGLSLADLYKKTVSHVFYTDNREKCPYLAEHNHNRHQWKDSQPAAVPLVGSHFSPFRNFYYNADSPEQRRTAKLGLDQDIIVCAPPYIPTSGKTLQTSHGAIDTGLLLDLVNFPLFSRTMILLASSLCKLEIEGLCEEIRRMLAKFGRRRINLLQKRISTRWAPFRVVAINDSSLDYLVKEKGLIRLPKDHTERNRLIKSTGIPTDVRDFKFWHQLQIYAFTLKHEAP